MKNLSLLSLALMGVMFLSNCKKETKDGNGAGNQPPVETSKQRAVALSFGGTWCGYCGAYGKPAKEQLISELKDDVVLISSHLGNDPLTCTDANSLAAPFATNGQIGLPLISTGGANGLMKNVGGSSSMGTTILANAKEILAIEPTADISGTATISGNSITVNTTTKFLKDDAFEYQVAAYVTENGITATQTSDQSKNKNVHDHVLRTKVSSSVWGESIGFNFKTGDKKDKSFTVSLNPAWNLANLKVAVVLWRKNSSGQLSICNGVNVSPK